MNVLAKVLRVTQKMSGFPKNQHVLLSYPKSGRTWVRFMVNAYLAKRYRRSVNNVFEVERDLLVRWLHPIVYTHFTGAMSLGRFYYDMGMFDERTTLVPHGHGVLLTRNIYSTLASAYFQTRYRIARFAGDPSSFLRSPRFGAIKIITFYNLWTELRNEFKSARVFSYEDLRMDTKRTFARVLESLGITPVNEDLLDQVVAESTFERMQQLSLTDAYKGTVLAPEDRDNRSSWKVRDGRPEAFRKHFSDDDLEYVARLIDDLLVDKTLVSYSR